MQFLTSLFGGSENMFLTAGLALAIVLVLILIGLWVLKLFFRASTTLTGGRNRRLFVVDSVTLDSKRQLLIVRRDNVEHVILTGGPQDLVVESNIPVERPPVAARRAAAAAGAQSGPRPAPDADRTRLAAERVRDMGPPAPRKPASLRHTGLLRPVGRGEQSVIPMNPERTDNPAPDSATTGPTGGTSGQARFGAGGYFRDVYKGDGG